MNSAVRKTGGGAMEGLYNLVMRRNSVYVTFVVVGAFLGERAVDYGVHKVWDYNNVGAVDYGVHKVWEYNNVGKRYEDISVLGQRPSEE